MISGIPERVSGNGVRLEKFLPADLQGQVSCVPVLVRRNPAGPWTVELRVEVDLVLPDGRRLETRRTVSVGSIVQQGRKKREAAK